MKSRGLAGARPEL